AHGERVAVQGHAPAEPVIRGRAVRREARLVLPGGANAPEHVDRAGIARERVRLVRGGVVLEDGADGERVAGDRDAPAELIAAGGGGVLAAGVLDQLGAA